MEQKYKTLLFIIAVLFALPSCLPSKLSNQRTKEVTKLTAQPIKENKAALAPALIAAIPLAVNIGYQQVTKAMKKSGEEHTATYSASLTGDNFYKHPKKDGAILLNLGGFDLERKVEYKDSLKTACSLKLEMTSTNQDTVSMLYFTPTYLKIDYPKARVKKKDNAFALKIDIDLVYYYYDKEGKFKSEPVDLAIGIPSVTIGEEYDEESLSSYKTAWFPIPPRSKVNKNGLKIEDYGNYYLTISVTETDEFGEKLVERATDAEGYREDFLEVLGTILKGDEEKADEEAGSEGDSEEVEVEK